MKQLHLLIALDELESMLDAPFFERSKSGMIPNQFGHCVIRYARLFATDLTSLCQDISAIRSGRGGRLAIGTIMGAIPNIVVPVLDKLHASQPHLSIEIVEDTSARMLLHRDAKGWRALATRRAVHPVIAGTNPRRAIRLIRPFGPSVEACLF